MTLPGLKQSFKFGGKIKGARKERRPFSSKLPIHVTLRSEHARGRLSLLRPKNAEFIRSLVPKLAQRNGVRVYRFANVGNHLHLLVQAKEKEGLQNFFRVLTGLVARKVTGAQKGRPFGTRFWNGLVFTRLVTWGRAFVSVCHYISKNQIQAGTKARPYQILSCLEPPPHSQMA